MLLLLQVLKLYDFLSICSSFAVRLFSLLVVDDDDDDDDDADTSDD